MFGILTVLLFTYYVYRLLRPIDIKKYGLFVKCFEDERGIREVIKEMNCKELAEFKESTDDVLAKVDTPRYKVKKGMIAIIDVLYFTYMFCLFAENYF